MKKHIILFASFLLLSGMLYASYRPSFSFSTTLVETKAEEMRFPCTSFEMAVAPLSYSFGKWCIGLEGNGDVLLPSKILKGKQISNRFKVALGPTLSYCLWERIDIRASFLGGMEYFPSLIGVEAFLRFAFLPEVTLFSGFSAFFGYTFDKAGDHQDHSFSLGMRLVGGKR